MKKVFFKCSPDSFCYMTALSVILIAAQLPLRAGQWTQLQSMHVSRALSTVACVNGKIYAIGGRNGSLAHSSTEEYDTLTNTWSYKTDMHWPAMSAHGSMDDEYVYIAGGYDGSCILHDFQIYCPATDRWSGGRPSSVIRHFHKSAVVNGRLYVIGGKSDHELGAVQEYDFVTDIWIDRTPMPTPRHMFGIAVCNAKIYAIGGNTAYVGTALTNVVEVFDPQTNTWAAATAMPTARSTLTAVELDGLIYAIGGGTDVPVGIVEVYNPLLDSWDTGTALPVPISNTSAVTLGGKIYLVGGTISGGSDCAYTYRYVSSAGVESEPSTPVEQRPAGFNAITPNPFTSTITIQFNLSVSSTVSLSINNIAGQRVEQLLDKTLHAGQHQVTWTPGSLAAGAYFARLSAGGRIFTHKIIKIK